MFMESTKLWTKPIISWAKPIICQGLLKYTRIEWFRTFKDKAMREANTNILDYFYYRKWGSSLWLVCPQWAQSETMLCVTERRCHEMVRLASSSLSCVGQFVSLVVGLISFFPCNEWSVFSFVPKQLNKMKNRFRI